MKRGLTVNQENLKPILLTRGNPAEEALPIQEIIDCAFSGRGKLSSNTDTILVTDLYGN
jgi:hypothetical protein